MIYSRLRYFMSVFIPLFHGTPLIPYVQCDLDRKSSDIASEKQSSFYTRGCH